MKQAAPYLVTIVMIWIMDILIFDEVSKNSTISFDVNFEIFHLRKLYRQNKMKSKPSVIRGYFPAKSLEKMWK